MGDLKWTSADGNLDATGSYNTAAKPISNDRLFFPSSNSQAVTTNVAALTAIDLDLLYVDENFGGVIASSGTPMEFSADVVKMFGGQAFHYKDGGGTTDLVIIACKSPTTVVTLDGSTFTKIVVLRGTVTITGVSGTIADLEVGWINNRANDANVTIQTGARTVTNLSLSGGHVTSDVALTNLIIDGGTLTQDSATITTVDIYSGFFNYNYAGTIATLNLRGGSTDFTKNDLAKTVTNTNRFPGSEFEYIDDITTFTNAIQDMRKRR